MSNNVNAIIGVICIGLAIITSRFAAEIAALENIIKLHASGLKVLAELIGDDGDYDFSELLTQAHKIRMCFEVLTVVSLALCAFAIISA